MFSLQIREKITITTVTTITDKIFRIVEVIRIKEIIITDEQIIETGVINTGHDHNNARSSNTYNNNRS
jgi:hypothetical protein